LQVWQQSIDPIASDAQPIPPANWIEEDPAIAAALMMLGTVPIFFCIVAGSLVAVLNPTRGIPEFLTGTSLIRK
jgi:hypothetical protein